MEIELYDAQHALELVGKKCKMFGPDIQVNVYATVLQTISADITPLLDECLDPSKLKWWGEGMAELARKYGAGSETEALP